MKSSPLALNTILFVSDAPDDDVSARLPRVVDSWDQAGLEEVISLQVSSSDTWRKSLAPQRIKSAIHIVETIDTRRILSLARENDVSMVVVDTVKQGIGRTSFISDIINRIDIPLLIMNKTATQTSSTLMMTS